MVRVLLFATQLAFIFGCSQINERTVISNELTTLATEDQYKLLLENKLAPDDTLFSFDGNKVLFSQIQSNLTIIDFWATWCSPCYKAIPHFQDLSEDYSEDEVNFLLISIDSDIDFWKEEAERNNWIKSSYWIGDEDFKNSLYSLVYEELEFDEGKSVVTALPHYVILSKNGDIHMNTARTTPAAKVFKDKIDSLLVTIK